jgi:porin
VITRRFVAVALAWVGSLAIAPRMVSAQFPSDISTPITGNWFGISKALSDKGILVNADILIDGSRSLRGGLDTAGSAWRNLFEATVSIDTKPLINFDGGLVFLDFQNQSGRNGSEDLVGDLQIFSNIDADGRTQLAQCWYQQTLFGGVLRIKAGKVDAASEFDKPDNGGQFIHSSAGYSTSIFVIPTYPDPATAFNVFVQPGAGFYVGAGVYDGSLARGVETGAQGPRTFFHDPYDLFYIGEAGRRWTVDDGRLPGRFGFGAWHNTNRFERFDGTKQTGAGGFYALFDQTLYRPAGIPTTDPRGIGLFLMAATSDGAVSQIDGNLGGGIVWTGPIPGRDHDVAGFGIQAAHLSSSAGFKTDHEVAFETFYRVQLTPWFSLKPDMQYIASPGGNGTPDALVATLRIEVDF